MTFLLSALLVFWPAKSLHNENCTAVHCKFPSCNSHSGCLELSSMWKCAVSYPCQLQWRHCPWHLWLLSRVRQGGRWSVWGPLGGSGSLRLWFSLCRERWTIKGGCGNLWIWSVDSSCAVSNSKANYKLKKLWQDQLNSKANVWLKRLSWTPWCSLSGLDLCKKKKLWCSKKGKEKIKNSQLQWFDVKSLLILFQLHVCNPSLVPWSLRWYCFHFTPQQIRAELWWTEMDGVGRARAVNISFKSKI